MSKKIIIFILTALFSLPFAFSQSQARISQGDVLEITVPGQSFLDSQARVSDGGEIEFAFLNVKVEGLTTGEAAREIQNLLEIYYPVAGRVRVEIVSKQETISEWELARRERLTQDFPEAERRRYLINPFDTVEIIVQDQPDLSVTAAVSEEGTIRYPLLGEVSIAGLDLNQAAVKIEGLLDPEYLVAPRVTVVILDYSDFSVLGAVNRPGRYDLEGPYTLLDAIIVAEGPEEDGNLRRVDVFRSLGVVGQKQYTIDAEKEGDSFYIKPKDKIIVPRYRDIYILGVVENPGAYKLERGDLNPREAIKFLAGGAKSYANLERVRILREERADEEEYILSLENREEYRDFFLKEGDRIYVEEYDQLFITGEVKEPGMYSYRKGTTALDAISIAGGFTSVANRNAVRVIRKDSDEVIRVQIGRIMRTGDRSADVELKPGDTVVVPESWF